MDVLCLYASVLLLLSPTLGFASGSEDANYFSVHPRSQSITEGSNATLTCETTVDIDCRVNFIYWFYRISPTATTKLISRCGNSNASYNSYTKSVGASVSVHWANSVYTLKISHVPSAAEGLYFCQILISGDLKKSFEAELKVVTGGKSSVTYTSEIAPTGGKSSVTYTSEIVPTGGESSVTYTSEIAPTIWSPPTINPVCSFTPKKPQIGQEIQLTCRTPEREVSTLTWSFKNKTIPRGPQTLRKNALTTVHVLAATDNCAEFTCYRGVNQNSYCSVTPLILPVTISPPLANLSENSEVIFHCSTETEAKTTGNIHWFVRADPTSRNTEIEDGGDKFVKLESGKFLKISGAVAGDNGTQVRCRASYEENCNQSSPWATLQITAPPAVVTTSLSQSLWIIVAVGVLVSITLVIVLIFWLIRKRGAPLRNPSPQDTQLVVTTFPSQRPDGHVYQGLIFEPNQEFASLRPLSDPNAYEIPTVRRGTRI